MNKLTKTFLLIIIFSCIAISSYGEIIKKHPVELISPPLCSKCHSDERSGLDHTFDFSKKHGFIASQKSLMCSSCHVPAFCADCHTNKEEIKPSDKFKDLPERIMPHRGDYITQHKIDGKVNPASCMKCHGRKNNKRCLTCHR
ncbi:MAG: cytochrome C [Thermodesulfovibrionales bacterium]